MISLTENPWPVPRLQKIGLPVVELFHRRDVGVGQVVDVDVVADVGAVLGGVVGAEDGDAGAHAEDGLEDDGDQVRFGVVIFADACRPSRSRWR